MTESSVTIAGFVFTERHVALWSRLVALTTVGIYVPTPRALAVKLGTSLSDPDIFWVHAKALGDGRAQLEAADALIDKTAYWDEKTFVAYAVSDLRRFESRSSSGSAVMIERRNDGDFSLFFRSSDDPSHASRRVSPWFAAMVDIVAHYDELPPPHYVSLTKKARQYVDGSGSKSFSDLT